MGSYAVGLGPTAADWGAMELTYCDDAHLAQRAPFLNPLNRPGNI